MAMRKITIGFALFLIIGVAAYLRFHRPKRPLEIAYAGNREVTLWNTTATVREPLATVTFGERLGVLARYEDETEVRTDKGITGWVSDSELLSSDVWDKARERTKQAEEMPVEARGHTRVLSNLHLEAGRDAPRLRQLSKDVPVDLLARKPMEIPAKNQPGAEANTPPSESPGKMEDWWLVLAHTPDEGPLAGWMLGRFIDLDVPQPLPDYASSADMRIVAWFELNRAKDAAGNAKPQYLVLGDKGPEGQACDFRQMRVYTWAVKHNRYETAFIDSDVCGKLPLTFTHASPTDLTFSFQDWSNVAPEERTYRMQQTIVRRVRQRGARQTRRKGRRSLGSASHQLDETAPALPSGGREARRFVRPDSYSITAFQSLFRFWFLPSGWTSGGAHSKKATRVRLPAG
jgi:hypothetical protein